MGAREWLLTDTPGSPIQAQVGRAYQGWLQLADNRLAMLGLGIVLVLLFVAAFAPWLATHSPTAQVLTDRLQPPSAAHWLGTDELGRDIYSRIVHGSRLTLYIVGLVVIIVGPVGLAVGTIAGYLGGWVDVVLMRITDVFLALLFVLLLSFLYDPLSKAVSSNLVSIELTGPFRWRRSVDQAYRSGDYLFALIGDQDLRDRFGIADNLASGQGWHSISSR